MADALNACESPWLLTYDDEPLVTRALYPERRVLAFDIPNTANRARLATELFVISDNIDPPLGMSPIRNTDSRWVA